MRPLERKLDDLYRLYAENFGDYDPPDRLPPVDKWHVQGTLLSPDKHMFHEARLIRLVHAILERASPGEVITSPFEYVRIYGKIRFAKKTDEL